MKELLISRPSFFLQNKTLFLSSIFIVVFSLTAEAGDTVFASPPNTRYWNPEFMQEVFMDEFNGNHLNTDVWAIDLCKSRGYMGNNEGEPNNVKVSDGKLKLTVQYEPANIDSNCWQNTNFVSDYTTAEITTQWNRFKYGCFEAKCFFPRGDHFYYAYWLWGPGGDGYPTDGYTSEIDIAEGTEWSDGTNHEMKTSVHYWSQDSGEVKLPKDWTFGYGTDFEGDWHVYKIIWNIYELIYYVDDAEIWRRSKYYTDMDTTTNDVGMNQIVANTPYHNREYFPNDEMQTVFQMHIQKDVPLNDLPVSMEVEYVKVSQYFLAPRIDCPEIVYSDGIATLDVDSLATGISWHLSPDSLFAESRGLGTLAEIVAAPDMRGQAKITYTFKMPSGEEFNAAHEFKVESGASANQSLFIENEGAENLFIFPNPAMEEATISLRGGSGDESDWNIKIHTSGGQLKLKKNNLRSKDFKINLSDWEKGVYMINVKTSTGNLTGKLVVTRTDR
jgi:hypothetical protein